MDHRLAIVIVPDGTPDPVEVSRSMLDVFRRVPPDAVYSGLQPKFRFMRVGGWFDGMATGEGGQERWSTVLRMLLNGKATNLGFPLKGYGVETSAEIEARMDAANTFEVASLSPQAPCSIVVTPEGQWLAAEDSAGLDSGSGALTQEILDRYPDSTAVAWDLSWHFIGEPPVSPGQARVPGWPDREEEMPHQGSASGFVMDGDAAEPHRQSGPRLEPSDDGGALDRWVGEGGAPSPSAPGQVGTSPLPPSAVATRQDLSFPRRLANAIPGGVAYLDEHLVFTFCNDVQASYFGMKAEDVAGQSLYEVVPDRPSFWHEIEQTIRTGVGSHQAALSITWPARLDAGEQEYLTSYSADFDEAGRIHGVFITALEVTESRRASRELEDGLRARNAALEAMLKERDLLVGIVSHELRTPLTTIFGNALLLLKRLDEMDPEVRTQAIMDIHEEADRINKLVENMLLLAQAGGPAPLHPEPVLIWRTIDEVVTEHRRRFPARPIVVSVKPRDLIAVGDFDYTKQIIHNLLANAEKYSPPTEQIDIRARSLQGTIVVSIWDRGPGILPDEVERVFTAFYRSALTSRKVRGTGIGLSVCKLLVEAQSGRIWIRSRRGGGAIFSFSSPAHLEREAG